MKLKYILLALTGLLLVAAAARAAAPVVIFDAITSGGGNAGASLTYVIGQPVAGLYNLSGKELCVGFACVDQETRQEKRIFLPLVNK